MKHPSISRRRMLQWTARSAVAAAALRPRHLDAAETRAETAPGLVAGEPAAARVGQSILEQGGNAVDAAVAAALAAAVASPHNCGIAGYGGHLTLAVGRTRKITTIDFNSAAPAAARPDLFSGSQSVPSDRAHEFGWLASGVPGTLAGLQLALDRYGTKPFREVVAPAVKLARDGFPVLPALATLLANMAPRLRKDAGSAKLLLNKGEPYRAGEIFANPALADTLETLARDNSVERFYRGDMARRIAGGFAAQGGLVTSTDLAEYEAREIEPLRFDWNGYSIFTAPLTAGGLTVLQTLSILKSLEILGQPLNSERLHARVEALRLAWRDRLAWLGDPAHTTVPVARLLSTEYAQELAALVNRSVQAKRPLPLEPQPRSQGGTIHLSAADRQGNLVSLTLTHGNAFGSTVSLAELGLTFGHGMSRFELQPGHPNSVGPRKHPLTNMCPTIVSRDGLPMLAIGGAGGRKIVNGVFDVLARYLTEGTSLAHAIAAPRLHHDTGIDLQLERTWNDADRNYLQTLGFKVTTAGAAKITAAQFDPATGRTQSASR